MFRSNPLGKTSDAKARFTGIGVVMLLTAAALVAVPPASASGHPIFVSAETVDLDGNGKLDAIKMTYDKAITKLTLAGWSLGSGTLIDIIANGRTGLADHNNDYVNADTKVFFLVIQENTASQGTGAKPSVSYDPAAANSDTRGSGGELAALTASVPTDKAKPVITSVAGDITGGSPAVLTVTFSEGVVGSGTSPAGALVAGDFTASGFTISSVSGHTSGGTTATVTATENFVRTDGCSDTLAAKATAVDGATTPNTALTTARQVILTGAPCLLSVTSNPGFVDPNAASPIGHEAILTFSHPVAGSGAAGGAGNKIVPSDLIFEVNGGSSIVIASMGADDDASADSTVSVKMSAPFALGDFGKHKFTPQTSITAVTGGGQVNPVSRLLTDVTKPTFAGVTAPRQTVDQNGNGLIDGIKLFFSETLPTTQARLQKEDFRLFNTCPGGVGSGILYGDPAGIPDSPTPGASGFNSIIIPFPEEGTPGINGDTAAIPCIQVLASESFLDGSNNALAPVAATASADKAGPAILSGRSLDSGAGGQTAANGLVDGVELTYSEPLGGAPAAADFAAETTVVTPGTARTVGTPTLGTPASKVTIPLTEVAGGDTHEKHKITYKSTATSVADAAGNKALVGKVVVAKDDAAPVLMKAEWDPATSEVKKITATFSEPVATVAGGNLGASAFAYTDVGGSRTISSVSHDAATATAHVAVLTMSTDVTSGDVGADTLGAAASSVYDKAVPPKAAGTATKTLTQVEFKILTATTRDGDGNGKMDSIEVTFSKAITDPTAFSADAWKFSGGTLPKGALTKPDFVTTGDTGNDNKIRLHFAETAAFDGALTYLLDYDCTSGTPPGSPCPTAERITPTDGSGDLAETSSSITVTDGIKPAVVAAFTRDLNNNGLIDAYAVFFAEALAPLAPPTYSATDLVAGWQVNGIAATSAAFKSEGPGPATADDLDRDGVFGEAYLEVSFAETSSLNSGSLPQLTCTTCKVKDGNGVVMADLLAAGVVEADRAPPVLILATSDVGSSQVVLTWSEGVFGTALGGVLTVSHTSTPTVPDVLYTDVAPTGTARTVSSSSHTGGAATATVAMSKAYASTNDFGADKFEVKKAVLDSSANGALTTSAHLRILTQTNAADITPPGAINSVQAVSATSTTVLLQWVAPGDDGTSGTVSSYEIKYSTSAITAGNYASATTATFTLDPTAPAASGSTQKATVTGLTSGTTYFFAVVGVDEAANKGAVSNSPSIATQTADTTAPAAPTGITATADANSVTLTFTAPGDDGATTGTVTSYNVKVSTSAITASQTAFDAVTNPAGVAFTYTPATLAAGGSSQSVQVTGLAAGTAYYFAIQAQDEVPNKGTIAVHGPVTTTSDTTAPTGTLVVTSSTHPDTTGVANRNPAFSWSGLTDAESTITYYYVIDQSATATIDTATAESTTGTTATFSNLAAGTWYFHIKGVSGGGESAVVTKQIVIIDPAPSITSAQIQAANTLIRESTDVQRSNGGNEVTWSLAGISPAPTGVDIWRSTSPFVKIATLEGAAATAGTFVDNGAAATAKYIVTVWYVKDPAGGFVTALNTAPGYTGLSDDELGEFGKSSVSDAGGDDGLPWWAWLLIALGILLVIGLIVGIIMSSRKKDEEVWEDEGYNWDDDEPEAAPEPEEHHAEEAHELECPKCAHNFIAHGQKPLRTTCPNCGVSGVLR